MGCCDSCLTSQPSTEYDPIEHTGDKSEPTESAKLLSYQQQSSVSFCMLIEFIFDNSFVYVAVGRTYFASC